MQGSEWKQLVQELNALAASLRAGPDPMASRPDLSRFCRCLLRAAARLSWDYRASLGEAGAAELAGNLVSARYLDLIRADFPVAVLRVALRRAHTDLFRRKDAQTLDIAEVAPDSLPALGGEDETHARIDADRRLTRLLDAIGQLPDGEREVLIAVGICGAEPEAVAERLGVSVDVIYQRVKRARDRLKKGKLR